MPSAPDPAKPGKFYVTTPIYYVNDRPHIGHVYTTTLADVVARHRRLRGEEVFFLTGTDEHAAKVAEAAAAHGLSPQEWADQNSAAFRQTFARLGLSNDDFIRTSQARHKSRVTRYVERLIGSGDVYAGRYEGWYDAGQEEYLTESKAKEYDWKSPINGKPLIRKSEKNYFFALSRYRERLLEKLRLEPEFVRPQARRNEVLARLREGLSDVPISRTGAAGFCIPMPGDPEQSVYVWIDALFNYLTTVDTEERRRYWPADVQLLAKDILWFHAVIWPALLMALGEPPPRRIYAHSFWISEGQKMSKSLGNFIDLERLDRIVADFSLDSLRWFLVTQGPLGATDTDFTHARLVEVHNTDLANTLGNCASRVTNMISRYFGGVLPAADPAVEDGEASALRLRASRMGREVDRLYSELALDSAGAAAMGVVASIDGFIEKTQPYRLAKDPEQRARLGGILYTCAEALRIASLGLYPILPGKIAQLWKLLGLGYDTTCGDFLGWCEWGGLAPGTIIRQGEPLFPRAGK